MSNKLKGKAGEELAKKYLIKEGYEILDTNFHYSRYGEIDIIAQKGDVISFVEVKLRTSDKFGMPFEAITKSKLQKIFISAQYYLSTCKRKYRAFQIDAISIFGGELKHIKNIEF